jgi:hypothetical protein
MATLHPPERGQTGDQIETGEADPIEYARTPFMIGPSANEYNLLREDAG